MIIAQEVLSVLSDLDVAVFGTEVRIATQLDRAMYTKVNKVLEALGGKWSRKAKAHVFDSDAQPRLDIVMMTGKVETGQDVGFFETPNALASDLVKRADVRSGDYVLEPSAGRGRIVEALQDAGACVVAVEWDPDRRVHLTQNVLKGRDFLATAHDFMSYLPGRYEISGRERLFDRVVMNPPFCRVGAGDHLDHVQHAFAMLRSGGVLVSVMPSSVEFRRDRRYAEFREWVEDHGTIEPLPAGSFRESGTGVNTCVVRMEK